MPWDLFWTVLLQFIIFAGVTGFIVFLVTATVSGIQKEIEKQDRNKY